MNSYDDVYIFNTFFYIKFSTSGYKGVCNWTSKVELFDKRVLLFPVHLTNHWCLVAVYLTTNRIALHDSLPTSNSTRCMDVVERYLLKEAAKRKFTLGRFSKEAFTFPQQSNSNDCGIFVCMNGRNIAEKLDYKFYLDIPRTRQHIKNELLSSKLKTFYCVHK